MFGRKTETGAATPASNAAAERPQQAQPHAAVAALAQAVPDFKPSAKPSAKPAAPAQPAALAEIRQKSESYYDIKGTIFRIVRDDAERPEDPWGQVLKWDKLQKVKLTALLNDPRPRVRDHAREARPVRPRLSVE